MRATVTTAFPGAEDGTLHPRWIAVGEIITGSLAEAAVAAGMIAGIQAASGPDTIAISAGNYGGKLGKFHFHLRQILGSA